MKHIHKYKKVNIGTKVVYEVYRCVKPGCTHYIPLAQAEGMICECNRCGNVMVIDKRVLTGSGKKPLAKPYCLDCVQGKIKHNVEALEDFLKEKLD